ncbi:exonuclease-domain-containing protein [Aspergillus oleicola]
MALPPSTLTCVKCGKDSFKTAEALANHQSALGHYQEVSKYARVPPPVTLKTSTKRTISSGVFPKYRTQGYSDLRLDLEIHGRVFRVLSLDEQASLNARLLSACHSDARLLAEGYRLTVMPPERKPRRKDTRKEESGQDTKGIERKSSGEKLSPSEKTPYKTAIERASQDNTSKPSKDKPREIIRFTHTPCVPRHLSSRRKALALDCEMVLVVGERIELAFLSVVDFFTGEVLINNYVKPTERVINWSTRYSGITRAAMNAARAAGRALDGWAEAQQALWRYADADTVLIGHSLHNDLKALRIIHPKIVDSAILTAEPVFNPEPEERLKRVWALKTVAETFLSRAIQTGGKKGHNCLEDTYATRDVVIWCLLNPAQLIAWARNAKVEHDLKMEQQQEAREREKLAKEFNLLMAIEIE